LLFAIAEVPMNANQVEGSRTEHNGVLGGSRPSTTEILGSLHTKLKAAAKENPRFTLVAVAAGAFALGGLWGSRLGRLALAASIPIVVSRLLDGSLSRKLVRWATGIPEAPPI
jgi:hypothetical protein